MTRTQVIVALIIVVVQLAVACGTGSPQAEGPAPTPTPETTASEKTTAATEASPSYSGVFFPTMRNPSGAVPASTLPGILERSEKGCLLIMPPPARVKKFPRALRDYPGNVPLWPSYFELDTGGGEVRVLDEDGRVVAQVGKRVEMGGGEIGEKTLRGNDLMGEREIAKLSERCPGYYWMVGENPHIPGRKG